MPINIDVYDKIDIQVTTIKSQGGEKYLIYQAIPKGSKKYEKVLFMLDGNAQFPIVLNSVTDKTPPLIIAVGHDTNLAYDSKKRTRDYTPKAAGEEFSLGGGADEFYRFIRDRVVPFVDIKFDIRDSEKSLFGHSFGGLFALFAMLQNEDVFDNFFIASPSLWWGDSQILKGALNEDKFKDRIRAKFVFVCIGELEKRKGKTDKAGNFKANDLAKILKNSGVKSDFKLYLNQTHGSVIPLSIMDTLKYLSDY